MAVRRGSAFSRLAPKKRRPLVRELCPDCGCCTLVVGDPSHRYDPRYDDWVCWCEHGPAAMAFDADGYFDDDGGEERD